MHESIETLLSLFMPFMGEVKGEHGGFELGMAQGALHEAGIYARFKQMRGVGMPEGMDGHACFGDPRTVFGCAEGALDPGATHRGSRPRTLCMLPPGGGKEPGGGPMGLPGGAEQREGLGGQGDVPVFGAFPTMDMDLEALTIEVRDLEAEGFLEPEAQARDGGEVRWVVEGGGGREESLALLHTEDGGETAGGVRTQEREGVPVALEDVLVEEADATVADTHGRWGEAGDIFSVQEGVLEFLCRDAVGGCVGELSSQTDFPDRGCLRPCALATELESRKHLWTQWGHEMSPSLS